VAQWQSPKDWQNLFDSEDMALVEGSNPEWHSPEITGSGIAYSAQAPSFTL
jgi:hypothetical protein